MTDQYRWTSPKPLGRDPPVEQGDVFEPTEAEKRAFGDLMVPVEDDSDEDDVETEEIPDGESGTLPLNPEENTIDELEEKLEDVDDEETLVALRNLEEEQQDRDGAIDAIEARLEEI